MPSTASQHVLFVAPDMMGLHGVAQSGTHLLHTLLQTENTRVSVLTSCTPAALQILKDTPAFEAVHAWHTHPYFALPKHLWQPSPQWNAQMPKQLLRWFRHKWRARSFQKKLNKHPYNYALHNDISGVPFAKQCGLNLQAHKHAVVLHAVPEFYSGQLHNGGTPEKLKQTLKYLKLCSAYIGNSKAALSAWKQAGGIANGKPTFLVPNCCNEAQIHKAAQVPKAEARAQLGIPENAFAAVCIASVQYRKGQDDLLRAAAPLMEQHPHLHIYLVGEGEPSFEGALRRQAELMGQAKRRIHIVGPSEEAHLWLRAANCCVLPTRAESFPISLLEAMHMACPIVSTHAHGIAEMLQHEQTALLSAPEDTEALSKNLSALISNPALQKTLAENAQARYKAEYTQAQQTQRFKTVAQALRSL